MAEKKKMRSEASTSNSRGESIVIDGGRRRSTCGYCRSTGRSSISDGLWANSLTVDDYQALLDRGWRRSGCFLYKPEMDRTCCPSYTIRLKASDFVPSKDQVRVAKRMQRYLDGILDVKSRQNPVDESTTAKGSCSFQNDSSNSDQPESSVHNYEGKEKAEQLLHHLSEQIDVAIQKCIQNGKFPLDLQFPKASVKKVAVAKRKLLAEGSEQLLFSSNISFQISSTLRRGKKDVYLENMLPGEVKPETIAEILVEHLNQMAESHGLIIRACNGHINFYSTADQACVFKSETVTKECPMKTGVKESYLNKGNGTPRVKRRQLEIRLKRSNYDPKEYSLYRKYQIRVHNDRPDRVTESSYRRFLVDTPLVYVPPTGDGSVPPCGFGSFHQQYLIDGQLIAVGVFDILPKCLSSKYLFWDPDLAALSLGKFSALEEIKWVRENQTYCPSLQYYYLGYYIHSCNKMRYKAAYRPSELLCPLRYQWIPFDISKPLLDKKLYVVLSDHATLRNGETLSSSLLEDHMEEKIEDIFHEGKNDIFDNEDTEMVELDSEHSDDESDLEVGSPSAVTGDGDVGNVLIELSSAHLRYKDLRQAFGPSQRKFMDTQLQRYMRAVGTELSERMAYLLS